MPSLLFLVLLRASQYVPFAIRQFLRDMHLDISCMKEQMLHFRGQARARSGTPDSTKGKINVCTCSEDSG
jgi:hypothetical protein